MVLQAVLGAFQALHKQRCNGLPAMAGSSGGGAWVTDYIQKTVGDILEFISRGEIATNKLKESARQGLKNLL